MFGLYVAFLYWMFRFFWCSLSLLGFIASLFVAGKVRAQISAQDVAGGTNKGALEKQMGQYYQGIGSAAMTFSLFNPEDSLIKELYGPELIEQLKKGASDIIYDPETMKATTPLLESPEFLNWFGVLAPSGGDVSGGGSVIRFQGKEPFLVDFIMRDQNFTEKNGYVAESEKIFDVPLTPENVVQGVEIKISERLPIPYRILQDRLNLWQRNSPQVVSLIRRLVDNISWRTTILNFRFIEDRYFPENLGIDRSKVGVEAVSAVVKGHGVYLLSPHFDNLIRGQTSRAGLLIHEALRTAKVEYSFRLSDDIIQIITANIMLTHPRDFAQGHLDELLNHSLFIYDHRYHASHVSTHVLPLCRRIDSVIRNVEVWLSDYTLPWKEESLEELRKLDASLRTQPNERRDQFIPPLHGMPLEDLPPATLNFWLRHFTEALEFREHANINANYIPGSPTAYILNHPDLLQSKFWELHIANTEKLRDELCVKGASKASEKKGMEFLNYGKTLLKFAEVVTPPPRVSFAHTFQSPIRDLNSKDRAMAKQAYNEAAGSMVCDDAKVESTGEREIPRFIIPAVIDPSKCHLLPRVYFKDRELPSLVPQNLR